MADDVDEERDGEVEERNEGGPEALEVAAGVDGNSWAKRHRRECYARDAYTTSRKGSWFDESIEAGSTASGIDRVEGSELSGSRCCEGLARG